VLGVWKRRAPARRQDLVVHPEAREPRCSAEQSADRVELFATGVARNRRR
jgi:hypothetical protein